MKIETKKNEREKMNFELRGENPKSKKGVN